MARDKVRQKIDQELKKQSKHDLLSPSSLVLFAWLILVVLLPYVLSWFGMTGTFWDSIPFEGEVSLIAIVVVAGSLLVNASKK